MKLLFFCTLLFGQLCLMAKPSNIVFFLVDDLGWKDLNCYGAELYETPNIDQLCADGMKFERAYTTAPICSPARASLMTGTHPMKQQMWNHLHILPPNVGKILPAYLKEQNYQTWHIGKWHLGKPEDKTLPHEVGFDKNIAGTQAWEPGSFHWPYRFPKKTQKNIPPDSETFNSLKTGKVGEYITDRLTDEALKLIDQRDPSKPIFMNFWYYTVHNVYITKPLKQGKAELVDKYTQKIKDMGIAPSFRLDPKTGKKLVTSENNPAYAAMIQSLDESVGRVVKKLKEIGEYENTLFIFLSDNGSTTDDVPCAPFNGGKNSTYEAGVRIPAIITWPGKVKAGSVSQEIISIADVFNTIMEVGGAKLPSNFEGDGISLMPILKGKKLNNDRQLVWYFPDSREHWGQRANAAIFDTKSGLKYIMYFNGDEDELYNINDDKEEMKNIFAQNPEKAQELKKALITQLTETYATLPSPPDKYKSMVEKRLKISNQPAVVSK